MALTAPKTLPPKLNLAAALKRHKVAKATDLPDGEDKDMWVDYYAERERRRDPSIPGVAQEALDCESWLEAQGRSPSEADNEYGYSDARTCRPAKAEERRILAELAVKPSKDIVKNAAVPLKAADVMDRNDISEFVAEPELDPEPEPIPE